MRATQENYSSKGQLAHVEKEQVDIKADIKIIQHDIVTIKENMATKSDIIGLNSKINGIESTIKADISGVRSELKTDISSLHHKIEATESRLENKLDLIKSDIGWLKIIAIAILTTVLGIAFAPIAQNMLKAPIQEAPDRKSVV